MNFLRLNDKLLSVLFEDSEIIAIDKAYGINTHTNDSKIGNTDFVQDGLIEIFEKQLGRKLHIVHRLDQTTTGVIIFAKTPVAAKKYAAFFFDRLVRKTYWFITAASNDSEEFTIDKTIIHKGRELEAKTNFKRLKKAAGFELWQANPLTGRNHQIRIHAQAAGISIIGDEKYEGADYPFLCLHNHCIEFPNGIVIYSHAPIYYQELIILKNPTLASALFECDRRLRLFAGAAFDQCYRLVHKEFGYTIDQFGKNLVLSSYDETWSDADQKTFSEFAALIKKPVVLRMMHNRGKDPLNKSQLVLGDLPVETNWLAKENEIIFEIRSDSGQSFGLFLDQRLQRNWVLQNSENRDVLNLFSYTCGFSVAAALGRAKLVTSVDTSKNVLAWGKRNFTHNGILPESHRFLLRDSLDYLDQCAKKQIRFDLVICDPPSFSRGEKSVFKIENELENLLRKCIAILNPGGDLLFSTNFENFFIEDIRKSILKVNAEVQIYNILPALDFELPGKSPLLKSFLIRNRHPVVEKPVESDTIPESVDEN